jgi:hypothetical protein
MHADECCCSLFSIDAMIPKLDVKSFASSDPVGDDGVRWLSGSRATHMGYVPSVKLSRNLELAKVGIWLDIVQNNRVVMVCKMPETPIRALSQGAGASLILSTVQAESFKILCLALKVQDEPESPFCASMPKLDPEEIGLLCRALSSGSFTLHCVNELNHAVLSLSCSLAVQDAKVAADAIARSDHWLLTPESVTAINIREFPRIADLALSRFAKYIYRKTDEYVATDSEAAAHLPLSLEAWKPIEIFEVSPTLAAGPFHLEDAKEGNKLERGLQTCLDEVFHGNTFVSPSVVDGGKPRELTDVIGFDAGFICLVEAKALAVITVDRSRSSARRAASVQKDIKKGLGQLKGAAGNLRAGVPILAVDGTHIDIPNRVTSIVHGIVLLSEMYCGVDWKAVAKKIVEETENHRTQTMFHVLDLSELKSMVARCKDGEQFSNRLFQRWCRIKERGTAYIRMLTLPDDVREALRNPEDGSLP